MAKRFIFSLIILIFATTVAEGGQTVLALQSLRVAPYESALAGFNSVTDATIKEVVLSEHENENLSNLITNFQPNAVLAIGMDALAKAKTIKDRPIIYLMVLNPQPLVSGASNISGVSMSIPQGKQMRALLEVLPQTKKIGLVYDPEKTNDFVTKALEAAQKLSLILTAKKVQSPKEVPSTINSLRGMIDVFWMIPDTTVFSPDTVEYLLLFSLENRIPVMAFSEKYVELGAFLSVSIDPYDLGVQAGELAKEVLASNGTLTPQQLEPRKGVVSINLKVARKLGIQVDQTAIKNARIIE